MCVWDLCVLRMKTVFELINNRFANVMNIRIYVATSTATNSLHMYIFFYIMTRDFKIKTIGFLSESDPFLFCEFEICSFRVDTKCI